MGMQFSFCKLIGDIGGWLLFGIFLAACIGALIPNDFLAGSFGSGFGGMLLMLVIGVPMYVCATASTPIAAAFALKGISPGAALIFLLAGPATNVATITVVAKMLGKRAATIYVVVIAVMSLLLGIFVNYLYAALGLSITDWAGGGMSEHGGIIPVLSTIILLSLIAYQKVIKPYRSR